MGVLSIIDCVSAEGEQLYRNTQSLRTRMYVLYRYGRREDWLVDAEGLHDPDGQVSSGLGWLQRQVPAGRLTGQQRVGGWDECSGWLPTLPTG